MADKERKAEAAEAASIRRRWITLGEIVAIVAVVISGLTFWNSYQERSRAEAERAAEKKEKAGKAQLLLLKAQGSGSRLDISPADPEQVVQSQTISFPSALDVRPIETVDPRIEADWIERAAKEAREKGGKKSSGDDRLPIGIATRFVRGDESHIDTAIYDVGYRLESGFLDTDAELLGLSLVERTKAGQFQTRLDALWQKRSR